MRKLYVIEVKETRSGWRSCIKGANGQFIWPWSQKYRGGFKSCLRTVKEFTEINSGCRIKIIPLKGESRFYIPMIQNKDAGQEIKAFEEMSHPKKWRYPNPPRDV